MKTYAISRTWNRMFCLLLCSPLMCGCSGLFALGAGGRVYGTDLAEAYTQGQGAISIHNDMKAWETPIYFSTDLSCGTGDKPVNLVEIDVGVRGVIDHFTSVKPFLGGGAAFAFGQDAPMPFGAFLEAGVIVPVDDTFNLGFQTKATWAANPLAVILQTSGQDVGAYQGLQFMAFVAWQW